jgi:hypothetical protein
VQDTHTQGKEYATYVGDELAGQRKVAAGQQGVDDVLPLALEHAEGQARRAKDPKVLVEPLVLLRHIFTHEGRGSVPRQHLDCR